jgi:hypothetical protein
LIGKSASMIGRHRGLLSAIALHMIRDEEDQQAFDDRDHQRSAR